MRELHRHTLFEPTRIIRRKTMHAAAENQLQESSPYALDGNSVGRALHLLYHELTARVAANSYQLQTDIFRSHLHQLFRSGIARIRPCITFDDGHRSNYEQAAPALEDFGVKAMFFITVGWTSNAPGDYMTWENLRSLQAAGHTIAAHGWSHKLFTHCDSAQLHREIVDAKAVLEDHLGTKITALSFPGGRTNQRATEAALGAGYTTLFTSQPQIEKLPLSTFVGRVNVRSDWDAKYMGSLFADDGHALHKLQRLDVIKKAAKGLLGDRLYSKVWSAVNRKEVEPESFRGSSK